jgi:hypothetical protein
VGYNLKALHSASARRQQFQPPAQVETLGRRSQVWLAPPRIKGKIK